MGGRIELIDNHDLTTDKKMRLLKTIWEKVTNRFAKNEIGQELEGMSQWLDGHPEILEWVAEDLGSKERNRTTWHVC
jgi:hypothetical protein